MVQRYPSAQVLQVAAQLDLADLFANGPRGVEDLTPATVSHASSLARLLRARSHWHADAATYEAEAKRHGRYHIA